MNNIILKKKNILIKKPDDSFIFNKISFKYMILKDIPVSDNKRYFFHQRKRLEGLLRRGKRKTEITLDFFPNIMKKYGLKNDIFAKIIKNQKGYSITIGEIQVRTGDLWHLLFEWIHISITEDEIKFNIKNNDKKDIIYDVLNTIFY